MTKEKFIVIREADITNNCPECFNQDMTLTFYQKHRYGRLFHRTTSEVTHSLKCNTCKSTIYPVKWTDDIERSFEYYQKMAIPGKSALTFTTLFYILILLLIVVVGAGVYIVLNRIIPI